MSRSGFTWSIGVPDIKVPADPPDTSSPDGGPGPEGVGAVIPVRGSVEFFVVVLPTFFTLIGPISAVTGPTYVGGAGTTPVEGRVPGASIPAILRV